MSVNLKQYPLNNKYGEESGTKIIPSLDSWKQGIGFKSDVKSTTLTGDIYQLSEAVQYLQFTGGLYDKKAEYHEGNIVSLVYKNDRGVYEIQMFRRAGSNIGATTNNAPYNDAVVETVGGVDTYSGGTVNADWVMCSTSGSVDAVAGTLVQRDSEGASKINMPSVVDNKSIVNKGYLKASNVAYTSTGGLPASDVQGALNMVVQGLTVQGNQITTNKNDITNLKGRMSTAESNISINTNNISSNTSRITVLEGQVGSIKPPIQLYYIQFPKQDGSVFSFVSSEEPANYYRDNFNINTTWELVINNSSMFFRTEGSLASADRISTGQQPDTGRNATGIWYADSAGAVGHVQEIHAEGVYGSRVPPQPLRIYLGGNAPNYPVPDFDISRAYSVSNEFRPQNLLIRIWKLKSINGVPIVNPVQDSPPPPPPPQELPSSYYSNLQLNQTLARPPAPANVLVNVSCEWSVESFDTNTIGSIALVSDGFFLHGLKAARATWVNIKLGKSGYKSLVKKININFR